MKFTLVSMAWWVVLMRIGISHNWLAFLLILLFWACRAFHRVVLIKVRSLVFIPTHGLGRIFRESLLVAIIHDLDILLVKERRKEGRGRKNCSSRRSDHMHALHCDKPWYAKSAGPASLLPMKHFPSRSRCSCIESHSWKKKCIPSIIKISQSDRYKEHFSADRKKRISIREISNHSVVNSKPGLPKAGQDGNGICSYWNRTICFV